jgi:hypothetical protein
MLRPIQEMANKSKIRGKIIKHFIAITRLKIDTRIKINWKIIACVLTHSPEDNKNLIMRIVCHKLSIDQASNNTINYSTLLLRLN